MLRYHPTNSLTLRRTSLFMDGLTMTEDLNFDDDQFSNKVDEYRYSYII